MRGPFPIFLERFDKALEVFLGQLDFIEHFSSAKMFIAAQTSLRSAILIAKAGTVPQCIPLLRHALECSIYGFAFKFDRNFYRDWKLRETSASAKKRLQHDHSIRSKIRLVGGHNKLLQQDIESQYDTLISFGAHPNVFQIDSSIKFVFDEDSEDGMANFTIFGGGDDRKNGYLFAATTYECCLQLIYLVWPERCLLLGIEAARRDALFEYQRFIENTR